MSVSGTGDYQVTASGIFAGTSATGGTATIDGTLGGFNQSVLDMEIGRENGYVGQLTLTGGGSGVEVRIEDGMPGSGNSASIGVGVRGNGTVLVEAGASLISTNSGFYDPVTQNSVGTYYNMNIGRDIGGSGTVTVDGVGSFLGAYGLAPRITLGRDNGVGILNVQNGASAGTLNLTLGRNGTGTLNIDGAGSVVTLSDTFGQFSSYQGNDYSGFGPRVDVGRDGGTGILNITDGGVLNIENTDGVTDNPFANNRSQIGGIDGDGDCVRRRIPVERHPERAEG